MMAVHMQLSFIYLVFWMALAFHQEAHGFVVSTKLALETGSSCSRHSVLLKPLLASTFAFDMDESQNYRYFLAKARECAYSDSSTAAEARMFLNEILELESDCVSGTIAARDDLCDNVDELAEIVALLRSKNDPDTLSAAKAYAANWAPQALLVSLVAAAALIGEWGPSKKIPFTMDEWIWAAKDGYLDVMLAHFVRNGGL